MEDKNRHVICLVFTRIPVFLKKTFKIFIVEIHVKMMQKLEVVMTESCKCGRFIDCRILSWFWEMHFPTT